MADILTIVAHPDDEILGCGGTLARHADKGDQVRVLIVAEGATSRPETNIDEVKSLRIAAEKACAALGKLHPPRFIGLADNRLDSYDLLDIIQKIETEISDIRPGIVYTHHGGDLNIDHRIVHEAVITACRPLPGSLVKQIYAFETVSSTEWATPSIGDTFRPNRFVDVSAYMGKKMMALDCYESEMRAFPHPRSKESIQALARMRGSQSGIGNAEAFETVIHIEN